MTGDRDDTVLSPPRPEPGTGHHSGPDTDDTVLAASRPERPASAAPTGPVREAVTGPPGAALCAIRVGAHGEPVALDAPCLIGRDPRPPRVLRGASPRLIRVPSPTRQVSATHAEIRQVGPSVVVTDARSTNGTVVLIPGNPPRTLRQGESVVVSGGTLIDLGDGVVVQVLSSSGAAAARMERQR